MGTGNAAVRQWMSNPERFADLFNGMVFEGEQVIRPEELEPADGETDLLLEDKKGKLQEVHRYRDLVMRCADCQLKRPSVPRSAVSV